MSVLSADRVRKVVMSFREEITWIVDGVREFLDGGLQAEDIFIIALDDRHARHYFTHLSSALADVGVGTNNIIADPYSEPPFSLPGKVTLSTVYRAKGNEAAVVFVIGVDAIPLESRSGRNRMFTAFTRTKAWLRISGVGELAQNVCAEVATAQARFPRIEFKMPNLTQVELIQRGLGERNAKAKKLREEFAKKMKAEGFSDEEIAQVLLSGDIKNG